MEQPEASDFEKSLLKLSAKCRESGSRLASEFGCVQRGLCIHDEEDGQKDTAIDKAAHFSLLATLLCVAACIGGVIGEQMAPRRL